MSHLLSIIYLPTAVDLTRCSWLTHEEKSDKQFEWHTDANWSIDSLIRRWIHLCIHTVGHHREDAVMTGSSSEVDMNNVLTETVVLFDLCVTVKLFCRVLWLQPYFGIPMHIHTVWGIWLDVWNAAGICLVQRDSSLCVQTAQWWTTGDLRALECNCCWTKTQELCQSTATGGQRGWNWSLHILMPDPVISWLLVLTALRRVILIQLWHAE